jgi:hypothetical protein
MTKPCKHSTSAAGRQQPFGLDDFDASRCPLMMKANGENGHSAWSNVG